MCFFVFGYADIANFSISAPQVVNFGIDRFDKVCSCKTDFATSGKLQICQNGQSPELLPMAVIEHTLKLIRTCNCNLRRHYGTTIPAPHTHCMRGELNDTGV